MYRFCSLLPETSLAGDRFRYSSCAKRPFGQIGEGCCNCILSYPSALWPCNHIIIKKYQVISSCFHIKKYHFISYQSYSIPCDLVRLCLHCFILNPIYPGAHCLTEAQVRTPSPSHCEGWWDDDAHGWCSWHKYINICYYLYIRIYTFRYMRNAFHHSKVSTEMRMEHLIELIDVNWRPRLSCI